MGIIPYCLGFVAISVGNTRLRPCGVDRGKCCTSLRVFIKKFTSSHEPRKSVHMSYRVRRQA